MLLTGSLEAKELSFMRLPSLARARLIRARRSATVTQIGVDEILILGCRERNSANTRLTTDAHVGISVKYSGEPAKVSSDLVHMDINTEKPALAFNRMYSGTAVHIHQEMS